jgi:hypothetical protein
VRQQCIVTSFLSKISFENYEWPLLQIMDGFFAISLSGLLKNVLVGLVTKNMHLLRHSHEQQKVSAKLEFIQY